MASTAIDLSRLPPPLVVETLSYEAVLAELTAALLAYDPAFSALTDADPAMIILQVCAYRELLVRQRVNDAARAVMVASAVGADLDNLGALMGVARFELTPADPDTGAPAVMEADEDFRRRVVLAPEGFSVAGPEAAYVFHALSADSDVLDASATSPVPGQVLVTVLSRQGSGLAGAALLETVEAKVSAEDVRPLTDQVLVQSAEIVNYAVEAQIYTYSGPDETVVLAEALKRLHAYRDDTHRLGRDVTRSGLFAALHAPGVQRVVLIQPAADVVVDRTQATWCTGITLTHAGLGD